MPESSITIQQPVAVKVIVTPDFRARMISEARESIRQVELNLERLKSAAAPEGEDESTEFHRQRAEAERQRMVQARGELEWRIKEAESIRDGAELPFQMVQGVIQLRVGDEYVPQPEIVIQDWKVVEIRKG
ncbi:MAG: hypothetical protein HY319_09760 [Armatimonadetes bacterium]|nr:hypothetical protein [Armatimonadota bacterium]